MTDLTNGEPNWNMLAGGREQQIGDLCEHNARTFLRKAYNSQISRFPHRNNYHQYGYCTFV